LTCLPETPTLGMFTHREQEIHMAWKTPKIVEIALGAEINSYACAERK
jgi:coenzyme PQQ precursor peptide PqqA